MATLAKGQSERGFVKVLASGTRVTTVKEGVEGCSSGSKVEVFRSAASRDCSNRSQP
jgi:hypothetical protein